MNTKEAFFVAAMAVAGAFTGSSVVLQASTQPTSHEAETRPAGGATKMQQATAAPKADLAGGAPQTFAALVREWKARCQSASSRLASSTGHPAYRAIIALGLSHKDTVTRLLLAEMRREPDYWFEALTAITEANPITREIRGNVNKMVRAWVEWGARKDLI